MDMTHNYVTTMQVSVMAYLGYDMIGDLMEMIDAAMFSRDHFVSVGRTR